MKSYLAVPVDKKVKNESTSPLLSMDGFKRLLARKAPRVPECGERSRRYGTNQAFKRYAGPCRSVGMIDGIASNLEYRRIFDFVHTRIEKTTNSVVEGSLGGG